MPLLEGVRTLRQSRPLGEWGEVAKLKLYQKGEVAKLKLYLPYLPPKWTGGQQNLFPQRISKVPVTMPSFTFLTCRLEWARVSVIFLKILRIETGGCVKTIKDIDLVLWQRVGQRREC